MKNWTSSEKKLLIGNSMERVETSDIHKKTMTKDFRAHAGSWDSDHKADHDFLKFDKG